jgi:hypothetical protein
MLVVLKAFYPIAVRTEQLVIKRLIDDLFVKAKRAAFSALLLYSTRWVINLESALIRETAAAAFPSKRTQSRSTQLGYIPALIKASTWYRREYGCECHPRSISYPPEDTV